MTHPLTEAIIAEANREVSEPYTTTRKIEGYFKNVFNRAVRNLTGGSDDAASRAKIVGRNLVTVVPAILSSAAAQIPVVGSYAKTAVSAGGELIADEVVNKLDKDRVSELHSKEREGTLSVREMTEMMQKDGNLEISDDYLTKMHDAIRKLDEAYTASKETITTANDFDSVCDAAKKYAYLKYRVVRLQYYLEILRSHLNELSDMNERYGAQVIGFEADLVEMMNDFFNETAPEYRES